ncbi:hypothetical protein Tco_0009610 [Tanacetum coccineum]
MDASASSTGTLSTGSVRDERIVGPTKRTFRQRVYKTQFLTLGATVLFIQEEYGSFLDVHFEYRELKNQTKRTVIRFLRIDDLFDSTTRQARASRSNLKLIWSCLRGAFVVPNSLMQIPGYPKEQFLGHSPAGYYRRFIEGFLKIAKPMTKLTQKKVKFDWSDKGSSFSVDKAEDCDRRSANAKRNVIA